MTPVFSNCAHNHRLLLVEDDQELASLIQDYLTKNGFQVAIVANGLDAVREIQTQRPALVILDVMLPGLSGMDVCRQARLDYNGFILMLTALDEDMDQMLGLELGADDYIVKPVQPRLLLSRIRALLRRLEHTGSGEGVAAMTQDKNVISAGALTIDLRNRVVRLGDRSVELTTAEFELLLLLARSLGEVVDRDFIIQELRGFDYDGLDRSIDRRISRLRKKLQDGGAGQDIIKTIRGKGYQLCTDPDLAGDR
ncbi:response regulator [Hahella aquimaris]|uniref:response regulator n=1 Tax=Hahella sp. HNIBRBA332 TaxID=3015983 RepID=UPI00273B8468|nr:response regulator [Hahella sp. HNIBRBA332]WLQ13954.1 response regulator [Hahella sp. HNIBRBA332]